MSWFIKLGLFVVSLLTMTISVGQNTTVTIAAAFHPPEENRIPAGPLGEAIKLGELIASQTSTYAAHYSGNDLNCSSCHLNGGRVQNASPWVGIWGVFPEYRRRNGRVNSLQDRINDCFERSMNGKPLPFDSKEMLALLAYMQWLSQGVPTGESVEGRGLVRIKTHDPANSQHGKQVYSAYCSSCHGSDGQGGTINTNSLVTSIPSLWGNRSFNIGAGMAMTSNAAAFVKANMPKNRPGILSDQDALDVAAFFTQQPRPDFKNKQADWPKGDKPVDARY